MNVKQLEAFKAIMRSGSTTAAAARLDLSQSAVSRLLTQLEAELGLELFAREKGRLIPTPEAIGLLDSVEDAVDGVQRVQHVAEELRPAIPTRSCCASACRTACRRPSCR